MIVESLCSLLFQGQTSCDFRFGLIFLQPMNSFVRNITTKILSFLMIGIMGLLIANKVLYTHTHKLENGSVYAHAHPYDKANDSKPYKSHHHTNAELLFLENLNILSFSLSLIITSLFVIKIKQTYDDREKRYIQLFLSSNFGRAPPVS